MDHFIKSADFNNFLLFHVGLISLCKAINIAILK
jgi:hypothetical protein